MTVLPAADGLRRPVFAAAVILAALVVVIELTLSFAVGGDAARPVASLGGAPGLPADAVAAVTGRTPPGAGIRYLAVFDGLVLFTVALLGTSLIVDQRVYGRVQGVVTLLAAILWILGSIVLAILALATLLLMIGLLVSAPFGTIAYLAIWGSFPRGEAAVVLGLLLLVKLVFIALLVAAQPRFAAVKGLMALLAASLLLQLVLGFLHGFLPRIVVSIGDQLWALVTAIVALVWAVVLLVLAVPAVVNAARVTASAREGPTPAVR